MTDLFGQLAKIVPVYVLVGIAILWLILKALPDSAQFFGDFFPSRRRLQRSQDALETLKAKLEVYSLSTKYEFQVLVPIQDAIAPELTLLLSSKNVPTSPYKQVNRLARSAFALSTGIIFEVILYGILISDKKDHVTSSDLPSFGISYSCALIGAYSAHRLDIALYPSKVYYYFASFFGFLGSVYGLWLGNFLVMGLSALLGLKS